MALVAICADPSLIGYGASSVWKQVADLIHAAYRRLIFLLHEAFNDLLSKQAFVYDGMLVVWPGAAKGENCVEQLILVYPWNDIGT